MANDSLLPCYYKYHRRTHPAFCFGRAVCQVHVYEDFESGTESKADEKEGSYYEHSFSIFENLTNAQLANDPAHAREHV